MDAAVAEGKLWGMKNLSLHFPSVLLIFGAKLLCTHVATSGFYFHLHLVERDLPMDMSLGHSVGNCGKIQKMPQTWKTFSSHILSFSEESLFLI